MAKRSRRLEPGVFVKRRFVHVSRPRDFDLKRVPAVAGLAVVEGRKAAAVGVIVSDAPARLSC